MNVDILKDNPRWTTYLYIAVSTFVLVILTVVLLKYLPLESMKAAYLSFLDSIRTRTLVWDEEKLPDATYNDVCRVLLNESTVGSIEIINRVLCKNPEKSHKILENLDNGGKYLCASAENGHEVVVRLLLENGADKDKVDNFGSTPLILVAWKGHEAIVRLLLEKGADKDKVGNFGSTPLSLAAENGHEAVVRLLLEKGADKDEALNLAVRDGHETAVRLLSTYDERE